MRVVLEMERTLRPISVVTVGRYAGNVARRYAAAKTLKYPLTNPSATGCKVRDALIEAMRLDTDLEEAVVADDGPGPRLDRYVDLVASDRAKSYAWWYALIVDPVVCTPFDDHCTGHYVDALCQADPHALEEYLELSSRYFTHAEVDRCITELRVAYRYLTAM